MARPEPIDFSHEPSVKNMAELKAIASNAAVVAHPSPAAELQANLAKTLQSPGFGREPDVRKLPFVWTAIGLTLFCAAFWIAVATLLTA